MDTWPLGQLPSLVILVAAVLAALAVIARQLRSGLAWCRKVARQLQAIDAIVQRELEHGRGDTMSDELHHVAVAVGLLQRRAAETTRKQQRDARDIRELRELIEHHHPPDENGDK